MTHKGFYSIQSKRHNKHFKHFHRALFAATDDVLTYIQVPTYLVCTNTYIPTCTYVCRYVYLPALYVQVLTYLVHTNTYIPTLYVRTCVQVRTYLICTYTYLPLISWEKHRVLRKWAMTERINQKIY